MSRDSLKPRTTSLSFRMTIIVTITRSSLVRTVAASTPSTDSITVPSTIGPPVSVSWTGSIPPLTNASSNCTALADLPAADTHTSTINVLPGTYSAVSALFTFKITWTPVVNINTSDEILTVVGVGSSDGGNPSETVAGQNLVAGNYKIVACGFATLPVRSTPSGSAAWV